jgi:hypothetical protein
MIRLCNSLTAQILSTVSQSDPDPFSAREGRARADGMSLFDNPTPSL